MIYDDLGAGVGGRIGFSEGGEAAAPFHPKKKPVDAYCACILDQVVVLTFSAIGGAWQSLPIAANGTGT